MAHKKIIVTQHLKRKESLKSRPPPQHTHTYANTCTRMQTNTPLECKPAYFCRKFPLQISSQRLAVISHHRPSDSSPLIFTQKFTSRSACSVPFDQSPALFASLLSSLKQINSKKMHVIYCYALHLRRIKSFLCKNFCQGRGG